MLKGNLVNLRHVRNDELDSLIDNMNDIEQQGGFVRSQMKSPVLMRAEFHKNGFSSAASEIFAIVNKNDELIGGISHMQGSPYSTAREIGFSMFGEQNQNKGFASEAVTLLSKYLFHSKEINRLQICMPVGHKACEKLVQKCGYSKEGIMRGNIFIQGQYKDTYLYSLLRSEFESLNP